MLNVMVGGYLMLLYIMFPNISVTHPILASRDHGVIKLSIKHLHYSFYGR